MIKFLKNKLIKPILRRILLIVNAFYEKTIFKKLEIYFSELNKKIYQTLEMSLEQKQALEKRLETLEEKLATINHSLEQLNKNNNDFNHQLEETASKISTNLNEHDIKTRNMMGRVLGSLNFNLFQEQILNKMTLSEFSVYSQWGEDGIIDFLTEYIDISSKNFVEIGVENYTEANTRFLLMKRNWTGTLIECDQSEVDEIKKQDIYWRYNLKVINEMVTRENINHIISLSTDEKSLGILSIDVDGVDWWLWNALDYCLPDIVIIEFNSVFGLNPWTVPYKADFFRTKEHYSNLYFGASLTAMSHIANEKGYSLVCTNSVANNAFFVRNDKLKNLKTYTPEQAYMKSQFRESRDEIGNLTYISGDDRIKLIKGMKVYNILKRTEETID